MVTSKLLTCRTGSCKSKIPFLYQVNFDFLKLWLCNCVANKCWIFLSSWMCRRSLFLGSIPHQEEPTLFYWKFSIINISAVLIMEKRAFWKLHFSISCDGFHVYGAEWNIGCLENSFYPLEASSLNWIFFLVSSNHSFWCFTAKPGGKVFMCFLSNLYFMNPWKVLKY